MERGLINLIQTARKKAPLEQSLLVGISGIDASGKGFITERLAAQLKKKRINVANINVDGWLNLPHIRFSKINPAENFYELGFRFDEMFEKLILPLKENRSIDLIADLAEESATRFKEHQYNFKDIDIILLEGIFLFKNASKDYFDLKIWIECPFETALKRAIERSQENLSPEETMHAYRTIFFPAQKIHFAKDNPQDAADLIFENSEG